MLLFHFLEGNKGGFVDSINICKDRHVSINAHLYRKENDFSCLLPEDDDLILEEMEILPSIQENQKTSKGGEVWMFHFDKTYENKEMGL